MSNIKLLKNNDQAVDLSIIGKGMDINGNISSSSGVDILGIFEGDGSFWDVNIRETGSVKGKVNANIVTVSGKVEGDLIVKKLIVTKTGIVNGNISYQSIVIEEGAVLNCKINQIA